MPSSEREQTAESYSIKSISLIRKLATKAKNDSAYIDFAKRACLSYGPAKKASALLKQGDYIAFSDSGRRAMLELSKLLKNYLTFNADTCTCVNELDEALKEVLRLIETSILSIQEIDDLSPDLLPAKESQEYVEFCRDYLHALAYIGSIFFGPSILQPMQSIELGDSKRSVENIKRMNTEIAAMANAHTAIGPWIIHSSEDSDGFFPKMKGCIISYLDKPVVETLKTYRVQTKKIARNLYIAEGESDVLLAGYGFVVGVDFKLSYKLRSPDIHRELPTYAFEEQDYDKGDPLGSIARYFSGDNAFCIEPQDLAMAIDRYMRAASVKSIGAHLCPRCGESIPNDCLLCKKCR